MHNVLHRERNTGRQHTMTRFGAGAALLCALTLPNAGGLNISAHAAEARAPIARDVAEVRQVDLRPVFTRFRLTIKRQGRRDTCHVFTLVAALEYAVARHFDYGIGLSEEYLNWAANQTTQQAIDGASFAELQIALKQWGVCDEKYMPYQPVFDPTYQPNRAALDSARRLHKLPFRWQWIKAPIEGDNLALPGAQTNQLNDAHIERIKDVLRRGWPVCAGREHNILIVGFHDDARQEGGGTFIVRNSNSTRYRTMTYAETKTQSSVALWIELPLAE